MAAALVPLGNPLWGAACLGRERRRAGGGLVNLRLGVGSHEVLRVGEHIGGKGGVGGHVKGRVHLDHQSSLEHVILIADILHRALGGRRVNHWLVRGLLLCNPRRHGGPPCLFLVLELGSEGDGRGTKGIGLP